MSEVPRSKIYDVAFVCMDLRCFGRWLLRVLNIYVATDSKYIVRAACEGGRILSKIAFFFSTSLCYLRSFCWDPDDDSSFAGQNRNHHLERGSEKKEKPQDINTVILKIT